CQQGSNIPYSF
nr:immunoglobulin light chain junction region [Macaca mulatta]